MAGVGSTGGSGAAGAFGAEPLITVSESSKRDICRDFRVPPERVRIIPLGVDTRVFRPREAGRVPGRIIAVVSADSAIKGVATTPTCWSSTPISTTARPRHMSMCSIVTGI